MFNPHFLGIFFVSFLYVLYFFSFKSSFLGLNYFRYFFIFMAFWILYILIKSSEKVFLKVYLFFFLIFFFAFCTNKILVFFIFFELSLVPTYYLVIKGSTPERSLASKYLVLYTFFGGFPLLVNIIFFGFYKRFFIDFFLRGLNQGYYFFFLLAFFIKLPIFFFHLWLPKAHVEASTEGRMVLAGILLKLGSYGLLIFLPSLKIKRKVIVFVAFGGIMAGLMGVLRIDMKIFIAYSSITHMSFIVLGSLGIIFIGQLGVVYMRVGHGFVSAGMFYLLSIIYKLTGSRNFYFLKGSLKKMNSLIFFCALCLILNSSAPVSLGFLGELFMFIRGSVILGNWVFFLIFFLNFIGGLLSIFFFMIFFHGSVGLASFKFTFKNIRVLFFLNFFSFFFIPLYLIFC